MAKIAKLEKEFRNRITGHAEVDPEQILAHALNFRIHPESQQRALAGAIDTIGYIDPVIVNQNTDTVIDGHLRVALALRSGIKSIPVIYVDLTEDEERQALLMLDPIAALAASDKDKLDDLLHQVNSDDERVQEMLADLAKANGLEYGEAPPEDPGAQIDRAEELREKWGVELGQLWQLGQHKLICGDCTDREVVERVMGGEKAEICWTDPPWNVAYGEGFQGGNEFLGWKKRTIINDNLGEKFGEFAESFCKSIHDSLVPGGILYMAMSPQEWGLIMDQLGATGFHWSSTIIWAKDSLVVSRKDYHTQYEPLWYAWREDAARVCAVSDRKQSDLWQIPRPKVSAEHPTMKPIELVERSLRNSSVHGAIVIDPFLGSGTTLIACERLNRKCRAVEISPGYVAVAIQRWVDMTGGEPVLLENE